MHLGRRNVGTNHKKYHLLINFRGLGKTLQAIALIWTLLKQGLVTLTPTSSKLKVFLFSPTGVPATKKAIVVTPSSLTRVCNLPFVVENLLIWAHLSNRIGRTRCLNG